MTARKGGRPTRLGLALQALAAVLSSLVLVPLLAHDLREQSAAGAAPKSGVGVAMGQHGSGAGGTASCSGAGGSGAEGAAARRDAFGHLGLGAEGAARACAK